MPDESPKPATVPLVVPLDETFEARIGLTIIDVEPQRISAVLPVGNHLLQPFGLVHGGVLAAVGESLASVGTWNNVRRNGKIAVGVNNFTSFMRPLLSGKIHAEAKAIHTGRTTWVWVTRITDDDGRLCATSQVTIAVRDAPS